MISVLLLMGQTITLLLLTFSGHAWHETLDLELDDTLFVDLMAHDLSSYNNSLNLMQATHCLHIHGKGAAVPRSDGTASTSAFAEGHQKARRTRGH